MATRLTAVPDRINAGTSVELTLGYTDYPADGGWTLKVYFNGPTANQVVIENAEVVANGKMFDVSISAAKTTTMGTGAPANGLGLHWVARVTKTGVVKDADEGDIIVDPDPATAGAYQSQAEKELITVNAAITARLAGNGIESYQIAGRAATYYSLTDLYSIRSSLESIVNAQKRPGRIQVAHAVFTGTGAER